MSYRCFEDRGALWQALSLVKERNNVLTIYRHPQVRLIGSLTGLLGRRRSKSKRRPPRKAAATKTEEPPEDRAPGRAVQYWTDTISARRYGRGMKLLKIVPALIVIFVVALLTFKRGTIFVPWIT